MTYDEMILVIQAAKAGKVIEFSNGYGGWNEWVQSKFDFTCYQYRVKPEPKRCWVKFYPDGTAQFVLNGPAEGYTEMVEVVK